MNTYKSNIYSLSDMTDEYRRYETIAAAGPRAFVYHAADAHRAAHWNTNKAY